MTAVCYTSILPTLQKSGNSSNSGSSGNSGSTSKTSNLSMKLGKDSKLTQQELQHHFEQNLCMFCGKVGHVAKECYKAIATKAWSASTNTKSADKTPDAKLSESKNQWATLQVPHQRRAALYPSVQSRTFASMCPLFHLQTPWPSTFHPMPFQTPKSVLSSTPVWLIVSLTLPLSPTTNSKHPILVRYHYNSLMVLPTPKSDILLTSWFVFLLENNILLRSL